MADHLTEEEQIEALKNWWKDSWKSVVIPIVMAALGYTGWNVWKDHEQTQAEKGGARYDDLVKALETAPGAQLSEEQKATAQVLATKMVDEFAGSLYADHANLVLARLSVESQDMEGAIAYLQRVVDGGANKSIKHLAKGRLARVKIAAGDFDSAVALVSSTGETEFKSMFAEIRGDALAAQGKQDAARTAFQEAIDNLSPSEFQRRSIVQLKLDGVGILASTQENAESVSEEPAVETTSEPEAVEESAETSAENS